jgi:hypothetical protein
MRFAVTGIAMIRHSRRRVGKARTEVIDTMDNVMFQGLTAPKEIEERYEAFWNDLNPHSTEVVKVIDVRALPPAPYTEEELKRFKEVAWDSYSAIAPDCWGEKVPTKAEFVDVLRQQMYDGGVYGRPPMTDEETARWQAMSYRAQDRLLRSVGP